MCIYAFNIRMKYNTCERIVTRLTEQTNERLTQRNKWYTYLVIICRAVAAGIITRVISALLSQIFTILTMYLNFVGFHTQRTVNRSRINVRYFNSSLWVWLCKQGLGKNYHSADAREHEVSLHFFLLSWFMRTFIFHRSCVLWWKLL